MIKRLSQTFLLTTLSALLTLMPKLSFSQDSSVLRTVLGGDTVVCLKPQQLKTLNSQIALLVEYKKEADTTIIKCNQIVSMLKSNQQDLNEVISNQSQIINNKDSQMSNLTEINKNQKKIWRRRFIYGSAGGLIAGAIAGILIAK